MIWSGRPVNCSSLFATCRASRPRYYATEARPNHSNTDTHGWPSHPSPTPYQIFNCNRTEPYSKRRFYELVKLYHPDHAQQRRLQGLDISEPLRLERFRLIVTANAILSDPAKRGRYDRSGAGWQLTPVCECRAASQKSWWTEREGHHDPDGGLARKHYGRGGPDDPARNATWEDWERWHRRRASAQSGGAGEEGQAPLYTSNGTFVAIVILLASVGALVNVSRANANGQSMLDRRDSRHAEISREMERRRREVAVLGSRDERVRAFLMNRDPVGCLPLQGGKESAASPGGIERSDRGGARVGGAGVGVDSDHRGVGQL